MDIVLTLFHPYARNDILAQSPIFPKLKDNSTTVCLNESGRNKATELVGVLISVPNL